MTNINEVMERLESLSKSLRVTAGVADDLKALLSYTKQCREALEADAKQLRSAAAWLGQGSMMIGGREGGKLSLKADEIRVYMNDTERLRQVLSTQPGERE